TPAREKRVRLPPRADTLAALVDGDHGVLDFLQRGQQRFERALGVGLDDQAELLDLALLGAAGQVLERDARRDVARRLLRSLLDQLGQRDLARGLFRADDLEDVS